MKSLYRRERPLWPVLQWAVALLCGAAYYVCCLPSFYRIGHFGLQTTISVVMSISFTIAVFFLLPRSLPMIGRGLSLFLCGMVLYAVVEQVQAHIDTNNAEIWWIYTFFYDRIYTVSLVWFIPFASILLLRLFLPQSDAYSRFRTDFAVFFSGAFRIFLVYYACVMIYCFFLQRKPGEDSGFNLVPFAMIATYFQDIHILYENIFYLLGNLLCMLPFGFYYGISRRKPSPVRVIGLPIVISVLIESTQLLFSMGHFDVDDILMNAVSFYIGFGLVHLFDIVRTAVTKGEERSIFSDPEPQQA